MKMIELLEGYTLYCDDDKRLNHMIQRSSTMVKAAKSGFFLYRGINNHGRNASLEINYPAVYEKVCDEFLLKKFSLGRQAMYGTGSIQDAKEYGEPYIVLLSDDFKLVWSKTVHDLHGDGPWPSNPLYADADDLMYNDDINDHYKEGLTTPEIWESTKRWIEHTLDKMNFENSDIISAIKIGNEIMFDAHEIGFIRLQDKEKFLHMIK